MTMNPADNNSSGNNLYDTDFYAWTVQQRELLAQGRLHELDMINLSEELDDMGKRQQQELRNRLIILMMHLLKWRYQAERLAISRNSGTGTLREQRRAIRRHLSQNPSLQPLLMPIYLECYEDAVDRAMAETGLDCAIFPSDCPFTLDQVLSDEFWPE